MMEEFSIEKYETEEYEIIIKGGFSVRILCIDARSNNPII